MILGGHLNAAVYVLCMCFYIQMAHASLPTPTGEDGMHGRCFPLHLTSTTCKTSCLRTADYPLFTRCSPVITIH